MTANSMPTGQVQVEIFSIVHDNQLGVQQHPQNQILSQKPIILFMLVGSAAAFLIFFLEVGGKNNYF